MPVGTLMQPGPSIVIFYTSGFVRIGATFLFALSEPSLSSTG